MSNNNNSSQYFPSSLKWASLSFFTVVILLAAISITISPQRITLLQPSEGQAPATRDDQSSANTSTNDSTIEAESYDTYEEEVASQPKSLNPTSRQSATKLPENQTTTPSAPPVKNNRSMAHASACEPGQIKGVIVGNSKYFYEMGRQKYYVIEKQPGVVLSKCFTSKDAAIRAGYQKAPSFTQVQQLLNKIKL